MSTPSSIVASDYSCSSDEEIVITSSPKEERSIRRVKRNTILQSKEALTLHSISPNLINLEYAVRGEVLIRSEEIRKDMKLNPSKYPFEELIPLNLGNPQAVGQVPISFSRQVLACVMNPSLLHSDTGDLFPPDVKARAQEMISAIPIRLPYQGVHAYREMCARWFDQRDGECFKVTPESILLTDGATGGIKHVLDALIRKPATDTVLLPIPSYPLYAALVQLKGAQHVGYYLDEAKGWSLELSELVRAMREAKVRGLTIRGIIIVNPGNPTGSIIPPAQMKAIIEMCELHEIPIIADEVYQANIYSEQEGAYDSCRRIALQSNCTKVPIFSFHSSSKGLHGECGFRGGLVQMENVPKKLSTRILSNAKMAQPPNIFGQIMMITQLTPPSSPTDPSYELHRQEISGIFNSLKRKAKLVTESLNQMKGVHSQEIAGAMYAFPRITIPPKAILAAQEKKIAPDLFYCLRLLEETGFICVPGSGFKQKADTFHIRLSILPSESQFQDVILRDLRSFNSRFLEEFF